MAIGIAALILGACTLTAFLSGIFGMAGGMILMAVLISIPSISIPQAMIIHGIIQLMANGTRVVLLREYVQWRALLFYGVGAIIAVGFLFLLSLQLEKRHVYLALGLVPLLLLLPKKLLPLDIRTPVHAWFAGLVSQTMNIVVGVTGPLMDIFYVNTDMKRQQIVGTKSMIQAYSHFIKIGFWTVPVIASTGDDLSFPPWWLFVIAAPLTILATRAGRAVLERLTDSNFNVWQRGLVFLIGGVCLFRAWAAW